MKRKVLVFEHRAKGQRPSYLEVLRPEFMKMIKPLKDMRMDWGSGWNKNIVKVVGDGRLFSFRNIHLETTTVFTSKVSEPVLALRFQMVNDTYSSFSGEQRETVLWPENSCCLFWLGDRTLDEQLLPGEHAHCDLFFRLDSLGRLSSNKKIKDLIDQISNGAAKNELSVVFKTSYKVGSFLAKTMIPELVDRKISLQRFDYLCDCLLLLCCGEKVDVLPASAPPFDETEVEYDLDEHLFWEEEERALLASFQAMSRRQLVGKFVYLRRHFSKLRNSWKEISDIRAMLQRLFEDEKIMKSKVMREVYVESARFFALIYESGKLEDEIKTRFQEIIEGTLSRAFYHQEPNEEEKELYAKWAGEPYVFPPVRTIDRKDLPESGSNDDAQNNWIADEQISGDGGFESKSSSAASKVEENNLPKEVLETYQLLKPLLSNTQDIEEEDRRSYDLEVLEGAYQCNDYIMLLQLELNYLSQEKGYVSKQDDTRLCHLLVAMEYTIFELKRLLSGELERSEIYELYLANGKDIVKLREVIESDLNETREWAAGVLDSLRSAPTDLSMDEMAALVNWMLKDLDFS